MMKHRKPKPCPFCGGKKTHKGYEYCDYIVCETCRANGPTIDVYTKNSEVKAVTAWNRRYKE